MNASEFLSWRKALRYTQEQAAEKLGVSRATIQNWEREFTRVPTITELACQVLTRRWKKRPEFGPVALVYADEPLWPELDCPSRVLCVQCELHPNNDAVLLRVCRLREAPNFNSALVIDEGGEVVWYGTELLSECDKR